MNASDRIALVRAMIREIVPDCAPELVAAYYDDQSGFAGDLFDTLGENPAERFTSDDLIAASLLDVRFGPEAIRALLVNGRADRLLKAIPNDPDRTPWNTPLPRDSEAWELWDLLVNIDGVGPTRASKLMARKRPHLFPILDTVIIDKLGLGPRARWEILAAALNDDTRAVIDALHTSVRGHKPSTLRLLDVATWMRHSQSRRAKAVRNRVGVRSAVTSGQ